MSPHEHNSARPQARQADRERPPAPLPRRRFLQFSAAGAVAAALPVAAAGSALAVAPGTGRALAAPAAFGPEPPLMHGYSGPQVKEWSPATDRFARYLRSRVPLAPRIAPFAPTQAHPGLDPRPRLMVLANDYVQPGWETEGYPYGPVAEAYALRFWQYADLYASWHGLPLDGEHDAEEPPYGFINVPNPGYTDAAHRNGVRSLGCWFWPRPEDFAEIVEKTPQGTFPVADKLIEMAGYFGFDGYFINQEAVIPAEQAEALMEMLTYLARKAPEGFHVQWYDSLTVDGGIDYQNEFNAVNSPWVVTPAGERISTSIFLNYWWNDAKVKASREHALAHGLDPFEAVYTGQEIGKYQFGQPYDPAAIFPEGGEPRTSWAFLGSEMVWATVTGDKSTIAAQAPAYTRERQLWSGPAQDPSRSGRTHEPDTGKPLDPEGWDGTAHHIVEKSPIGRLPFVTRFCTGTGERFFIDGEHVGDRPWFDIGVQDLLPTWQWWVRDGDGAPSDAVRVDYDHTDAYDGGSSLRLTGGLKAGESAVVRLYKTALTLTATTSLGLVHRRSGGAAELTVGLVFADDPTETAWLTVEDAAGSGWSRWSRGLGRWAGRTVAAIGVGLTAGAHGAPDIAVNLGELRLTADEREHAPRTPAGFTVDRVVRAADVASVYLGWEFAPRGVAHYDLFRRTPDGGREWLGRTFDGAYCVPSLELGTESGTARLELEAVSPTGRRSEPAHTRLTW
ncbi:endo-beta-N-acetylglucosaminidase [Streptomyces formicae]|uniref:Cytosolic endo-beta-N-acetylglucosaminidase TIM barrel domain-containing protein n=1 Tax=Streptomyces formicae TaxID=1616117 RepID=A0ABY3WQ33_9ACTN|nr:hypothetical protein [Streptomyces formicae]UNM13432.1 hypothetical protein J4032_19815 [Streptomyces formicae]